MFQNSEASLPVCSPNSVCNKVDTYSSPWVEKQCRCPSGMDPCSTSVHVKDGHTISDRNRQYKVSQDISWWLSLIGPYFNNLFILFYRSVNRWNNSESANIFVMLLGLTSCTLTTPLNKSCIANALTIQLPTWSKDMLISQFQGLVINTVSHVHHKR